MGSYRWRGTLVGPLIAAMLLGQLQNYAGSDTGLAMVVGVLLLVVYFCQMV